MSITIAIVLNVSGKAWAEAPDGSRRLLDEGSALMAGERLITEDDTRILLDFGYGNSTIIEGSTTLLATPEMAGNFAPELADTSVEDDSIAQALASIEEALGGSIEDAEAPAAGLEGGSSGGSSSVRLARIVETIDPAEFGLERSAFDNDSLLTEEGNGTDDNTPAPGDIAIGLIDGGSIASPTLTVTGSSNNLLPSSTVQIDITDQNGSTVSQQVTAGPDGSFTGVFSQLTELVDGPLTIVVAGTGRDGIRVTDTSLTSLDVTAGTMEVSISEIDNAAQTIDLEGLTTDVAPGQSVNLTITDADGNVVTTTALVGSDGSYSVTGTDISGLVDGNLTVTASAVDRNDNPVSGTDSSTLDAVAGILTITGTSIDDDAQSLDLAGITADVAPGLQVNIIITDAEGNQVTTTAIINSDGSFSVTGVDVSTLVDGTLTVTATATDRNGGAVSDTASDTLDNLAGDLTVAVDGIDDTAQTLDLSGTTSDVAQGDLVSITITDADNNVVTTSAVVAGDGSYSLTGIDISGLVDGPLTVAASATDRNGNPVSDSATGALDATDGDLAVTVDAVDSSAGTIDLSGTTDDVAPNSLVNLTITDTNGVSVSTTATVGADGSYSVSGTNISALADGTLTVTATATDRNGGAVSDTANGTLDALAGDLAVTIDAIDNDAQTIDLSGTTTDFAEGSIITLTITDSGDTSTSVNVQVGANGTYSVSDVDTSSLANGSISVEATGTDRNGQDLSASTTGVLDVNIAPDAGDDSYDTNATQGLFGEYFAYQQGPDGNNLSSISQVEAFIAATEADATFTGTNISYGPVSGNLGGESKIQDFLKGDAGSLSGDPANSSDAIIRMSGEMELAPGTYQFRVTADDGYRIVVNGDTVIEADRNQSAQTATGSEFTLTGAGPHSVEIVYWDQGGVAALEVEIRPQGGTYETLGSQHVSHNSTDTALIIDENQTLTIAPATLLDNDLDANGDPLVITSVQDAANGSVSLDSSGNVIFTPDDYYTGEATFSYTISDGRGATDTATVTVNVLPAADSPILSVSDTAAIQAGDTIISTGADDLVVDPNTYDSGSGVSQAALERELGVGSGFLDGRFDPTGQNANDPGTVNIVDGKITEATQALNTGMEISWDYTFVNGEDLKSEVENSFNDIVALVVTAPSGAQETLLVDSSENKFPNQSVNGSFSYTASESGAYKFQWLILNGGDSVKDSSLELLAPTLKVPGFTSSFSTIVALSIDAALADQDGSETLSILIDGMPGDAELTAGTRNPDGTWSLAADELEDLFLLSPEGFAGDISLDVTATTTETATGLQQSVTESLTVTVDQTDTTISGTGQADVLQGSAANDLIRGYDGDDTLNGGAGNDYLLAGAGNDTLIGGSGADVLTGGVGADVFRWELGDESDSGIAHDVVTDFTVDAQNGYTGAGQGDQLELSDLLQDASAETITDYMMAKEENGDTVLYLNKDGALNDNGDNAQQSITLSGITMDGQSSEQFIDSMLNNGHIKIE